jgi:hypothetical protein
MTTAVCPSCGALWVPTLEERIAAKSDAPPCFICRWAQTEEGKRAIAEGARFPDGPGSSRFAGSGSSSGVPTTPEQSGDLFARPGAILDVPREVSA